MSSEIEEPFSLGFRAESLHSGSISFGRFENEVLCWERRSSFSHNRYLEEVERYSKPGSVTEKKAYFEAHFKRRALLSQGSSECQSGTEYQTTDNDISDIVGYEKEFDHLNRESHSTSLEGSFDALRHGGENEIPECRRQDARSTFSEFLVEPSSICNNADHVQECPDGRSVCLKDGSSGLGHDGEDEIPDCRKEDTRTTLSQSLAKPAFVSDTADHVQEHRDSHSTCSEGRSNASEHGATHEIPACKREDTRRSSEFPVKPDFIGNIPDHLQEYLEAKVVQSSTESDNTFLLDSGAVAEIKENYADEVVNLEITSGAASSDPDKNSVMEDAVATLEHKTSRKERSTSEIKQGRPRSAPQVNIAQGKKNYSTKSSKDSSSQSNRRGNDLLLRSNSKSEKQVAHSLKEKMIRQNSDLISNEEEAIRGKVADLRPSTSESVTSTLRKTTTRVKQNGSITAQGRKPSKSPFNFKSGEQVERRKEFNMKLEQKLHAKDAEMHQIQEKKQAEIKQLRRSLNFRATPLPSFYHEAGRGSHKSKDANNSSSTNSRCGVSSVGNIAAKRSPNGSVPSSRNASHFAEEPRAAKLSSSPTIAKDGASPFSTPVRSNGYSAAAKKATSDHRQNEQGKEERVTPGKQKISEVPKINKSQKPDGAQKGGSSRISSSIRRKEPKSFSTISINRQAVGVTS